MIFDACFSLAISTARRAISIPSSRLSPAFVSLIIPQAGKTAQISYRRQSLI
jgi:hypothetical protein